MRRRVVVERCVESVLDQCRVADAKTRYSRPKRCCGEGRMRRIVRRTLSGGERRAGRTALVGIATKDAVVRMDQLIGERRDPLLEQLLANLGPVAAEKRHLELTEPWSRG